MIKVGVTGGIGSGKTTFCKKWEKLGAFVLFADDLAKELMTNDQELVSSIRETFGDGAYNRDGTLNRTFLAEEAFNKGRVEDLNAIVHPILWKRIDEIALQKEKEGIEIFVKEAAILLQNGRPKDLDFVVLLLADEEKRINRSVERDQTNSKKIEDRISKQPDFMSKKDQVDFVVENNETISKLEKEAERIFKLIK